MIRGVPYDAEVEWLESTGTQYIDTGVYFTQNSRLDADLMFRSTGTQQFGSGRPSSSYWAMLLGFYNNKVSLFAGKIQEILAGTTTYGVNIRVSVGFNIPQQSYYIGDISGTSQNITEPTTSTQSFSLFARHNGEGVYSAFCSMRLYSISIHDGANPIIDLIPVRFTNELKQSEGAMYDRVTRKLFRNKGTGAFVIGPDVARPIMGLHFMKPRYSARDYVQDGLIYHIDAAENIGYGQFSDTTLTWVNLKGGNNATIPSATPLVWSKQGCDFKGRTYGQWISIPAAAFPSTVRTIEWCGACYNSTVYSRMLIDNRSSGSNTLYFGLGNNYDQNGAPGNFAAFLGTGNGTSQANFNIKAPAQGVKGTVGVGFSAVNDIRGIVNGVYYTDKTYNNIASMPTFGVGGCMPSPSSIRTCNIVCCGLRVYDRILTAAEIAHNYAVDKVRFKLPEVSS